MFSKNQKHPTTRNDSQCDSTPEITRGDVAEANESEAPVLGIGLLAPLEQTEWTQINEGSDSDGSAIPAPPEHVVLSSIVMVSADKGQYLAYTTPI